MINFLNLEYFLVAAEELNFTKAAKRLYISQQSLSNHIANLEKEFDVMLTRRSGTSRILPPDSSPSASPTQEGASSCPRSCRSTRPSFPALSCT